MKVLFSDIDNTLVFSHRKNNGGMNVVAEYLNGKEQSFMTQDLYNLLLEHKQIEIIPVTTRTIEQYSRLFVFDQDFKCEYALVCNGGILLRNGSVDEQWRNETLRITYEQNKEVCRLLGFAKNEHSLLKLATVDEFMFYAVFDESSIVDMYEKLSGEADLNQVMVEMDSRKIYVIAKNANKGTAIQRFQNEYRISNCIVAGDSNFDISMLNGSNRAIASKELFGKIDNKNVIFAQHEILAYDVGRLLSKELGIKND